MSSEISHKTKDERRKSVDALELGAEKPSLEPPSSEDAPDGGTRAWLVAAGGAAIFFSCLGFSNAFGVFEEYYLTHRLHGQSPDNIAWIGSTSAFLQFFAGLLGGPMFDRFGAKIIRPAAIAYIFAIMMLSLCREYWQVMLVQGILMGLVMGFLQIPAFAAVSQYFDKKRAAAFGIVVSGSSIGGVVIPIALSKMLNGSALSFGWSVRVIGFLLTPFLGFACVAIKPRLSSRTTNFWIPAAFKDIKFNLLILALFFMFIGMWTPLFYIPTYAVSKGMSATLAGYLLAIINAASTFGRVIPGVFADKYGRLNMFGFGGIATGVVVFCMNSTTNNAGIIVYAVVFGFFSGTIISGASAAFSIVVKDARDMGTYMGMGMAVAGLGGLIGPPVNGAFVERYGGFIQVSIFSGTMCVFGGFIALGTKCATAQGVLGRV
ncbi:related to monocarboxylate transporter 4 [Phialocephala subalpina]|uniref:Related to monocarboxylate transporter 4 n=1 Tax=Phialocephala subalpina TaxID=576137 RepID=A0A1L7WBV0_9HELO|nr:related to monocarboxylate transporter 4 [Phialocephala subalpina]